LDNNLELFETIIKFIESDLMKENKGLPSDIEILSNLSGFPVIPKILLKNKDLFDKLYKLYLGNKELRHPISNILKNIFANNLNSEIIINDHIDLINTLKAKILNEKPNTKSDSGLEIANNEIDSLIELIKEHYKPLIEKKVLSNNEIKDIIKLYSDVPEINAKLLSLQKELDHKSFLKYAEDNLKQVKETVKHITEVVRQAFEDHLNELESMKSSDTVLLPETVETVMTTATGLKKVSGNRKVSLISKMILFNPNNVKCKSPISCKDNSEIIGIIEQILTLMRKLYNENKTELNTEILQERITLIEILLENLKGLSISPDNHVSILELGLLNFMERSALDLNANKQKSIYSQCIDVLKNCTYSENAIPVFLSSTISDLLVIEVVKVYFKPELLSDPDVKQVFQYSNAVFSNLCKNKKGFSYLCSKLNQQKLLEIAEKTYNMDIIAAILEMFFNYIRNNSDEEINPFADALINLLLKSFSLSRKTDKLLINSFLLTGVLYKNDYRDKMSKLEVVKITNNEFEKFASNEEFINAVLFCLGKVTENNYKISKDVIDTGLLLKLQESVKNFVSNASIVENISGLYNSLVKNNLENIEKCIKMGVIKNIFSIIDNYLNSQKPEILLNCVTCLDSITISDTAINYLATETKFVPTILDLIEKKPDEFEMIKYALHSLGSYIYKDLGANIKSIDTEKLIAFLQVLQKRYYPYSDILININYIAGYLIKFIKDKSQIEKLFLIISDSIKIQDWNVPLILMALKLTYEILSNNSFLQDDIFENNMHCLFNLIKNHKDNLEILIAIYKILSLFAKNSIYSYTMINNGLLDLIRNTLDNQTGDKKFKNHLSEVIYNLLTILSKDSTNALKISDALMNNFMNELKSDESFGNQADVIKLISVLIKNRNCVEPLIQFNGFGYILKILVDCNNDIQTILNCFNIIYSIVDSSENYKKMASDLKVYNTVSDIVQKKGYLDKRIEFEGRTLIYAINSQPISLEAVDDINYIDIKVENPIKPDVRNYLTDGKVVKM
jgi:hypothetical protein